MPPPAPTATHSWPPVPVLKAKTAPASDPKLTVLPSEESAGDEAKAEPAAKAHSCEPVSAAHERGIGQHREEDCSVGASSTPHAITLLVMRTCESVEGSVIRADVDHA